LEAGEKCTVTSYMICTCRKYYSRKKIKEDKMGGVRETNGEKKNV